MWNLTKNIFYLKLLQIMTSKSYAVEPRYLELGYLEHFAISNSNPFILPLFFSHLHGKRNPGRPPKTMIQTPLENSGFASTTEQRTLMLERDVWHVRHCTRLKRSTYSVVVVLSTILNSALSQTVFFCFPWEFKIEGFNRIYVQVVHASLK